MGNSNSIDYAARNKININQWTEIQTNQQHRVLKNQQGKLAQQYQFFDQSKLDQTSQLQIYDYRRIQDQPIVKVYGVNFTDSSSSSCCGKTHNRKVLTERIPFRLSNIGILTFPEALFTLNRSLRGYQQISKRLGTSYLTSNMFGITPQGFVKVWINQNWGQNHPPAPISTQKALDDLHGSNNQQKMVQNIFRIVESVTEGGKYPQTFKDRLNSQKNLNFVTAQNLVNSYSLQNNIIISSFIKLNRTNSSIIVTQSPSKVILPPLPPTTITSSVTNNVRFTYISGGNTVRASNPIVFPNNR